MERGGGGRLFTFSAFRMGAYSRWALMRGWALILINESYIFHYGLLRDIIFPSFSPRNQSAGYFFSKSTLTPLKVKWSAPKFHQTFAQLTDSDLPNIFKAF